MSKTIPIYGGEAIVDDEDFERLSKIHWYKDKSGYAISNKQVSPGKWITYRMHRLVINCPAGLCVDHIDGNRLDNRKCNLREATHLINNRNRTKTKLCKTGYKGVFPLRGKYQASIGSDGKQHYLGFFKDPALAALAYNRAAVQLHGDFARLNAVC